MKPHLKIIYEDIQVIVSNLNEYFDKISGSTFVITGPNGLIASYIVDTLIYLNDHRLLKRPCKILGLERLPITKRDRLGHLLGKKDVYFVQHDVRQPYKFRHRVDYIVHAAGWSAPATFLSDPLGTVDVNLKGIRWILDYAKENKVKSLLYMSSGEIYGNPSKENIPTPETYNGNVSTLAPRACYTESKRLSETLCNIYYQLYKVPVKIARPFIVYGPGLAITDRRVMADFMRFGIEKKPIEMLSEGLDTRSYCYITDATILFFKLLFSKYDAQPFNVANNREEISIRELAELVHRACGIKKKVKVKKTEGTHFISDAPSRVCPDISRAEELLEFDPKVGIKEGLARTINWNKAFFNKK